jgi:hypothetical protein
MTDAQRAEEYKRLLVTYYNLVAGYEGTDYLFLAGPHYNISVEDADKIRALVDEVNGPST